MSLPEKLRIPILSQDSNPECKEDSGPIIQLGVKLGTPQKLQTTHHFHAKFPEWAKIHIVSALNFVPSILACNNTQCVEKSRTIAAAVACNSWDLSTWLSWEEDLRAKEAMNWAAIWWWHLATAMPRQLAALCHAVVVMMAKAAYCLAKQQKSRLEGPLSSVSLYSVKVFINLIGGP